MGSFLQRTKNEKEIKWAGWRWGVGWTVCLAVTAKKSLSDLQLLKLKIHTGWQTSLKCETKKFYQITPTQLRTSGSQTFLNHRALNCPQTAPKNVLEDVLVQRRMKFMTKYVFQPVTGVTGGIISGNNLLVVLLGTPGNPWRVQVFAWVQFALSTT